MNYIFFKQGRTGLTGRRLRTALHCRTQRSLINGSANARSVTKLIRWGESSTEFGVNPTHTLNNAMSIAQASNKLRALEAMRDANVRVPFITRDKAEAAEFLANNPGREMIGRTTHHQGGAGFNHIRTAGDLRVDRQSSHWMERVGIANEYRVHVFQGDIIGISRKTNEGVENRITDDVARNHTNGWRFVLCDIEQATNRLKAIAIEAVNALGLDFGAVDILLSNGRETTTERRGGRRYYVLEVNSAPSLEPNSTILANYTERLSAWLADRDPQVAPPRETPVEEEPGILENIDEEETLGELADDEVEDEPEPDYTEEVEALRAARLIAINGVTRESKQRARDLGMTEEQVEAIEW